jgi:hypothetical protein
MERAKQTNNPELQNQVAAMTVACLPEQAIADKLGISQPQVNRIKHTDATKEKIAAILNVKNTEWLDKSVEIIDHALNNYKSTDDTQLREHGFRFVRENMIANGIFSGNGMSVHINAIYNDNRTTGIPEVIQQLLQNKDVIDAEYSEIGNEG